MSQGAEGQHLLARLPWGILATTAAICGLGVMNLSSAAQATRPDLYLLQLGYIMAAGLFGFIVARTRLYVLEAAAYPLYAVVVGLLVLVLVAGTTVKGAQRWLDLGVFMLQPSEIGKVAIILVTARYFSRYRVEGGFTLRGLIMPLNLSRPIGALGVLLLRWSKQASAAEEALLAGEVLEKAPDPTWAKALLLVAVVVWIGLGVFVLVRKGLHHRRLLAPIDVVLLPWALIVIEPDLGTSLIVLAIAGSQILFCGVRRTSLLIAAVAVGATAIFGWNFILKDYQKRRVETFLDPEADLQGAGYHAAQSMIAIGSGQLTGKGYGEGTQTQLSFLPENHTDFVFSVLAEEWGLVGAGTLILLFLMLILLILRDARQHTDRFAVLVNVGSAAMIFWHVLINIGMVTALMPVVGMTLPLVSYGGSSLVTQMACVAFAVNTRIWGRS